MATFIEYASSASEMRDKIVEWLQDRARIAKQNAVRISSTQAQKRGYEREVYCYGEAARFWKEVLIEEKEST